MCLKFVKVYPADLWIIGILKSAISKANLSTMCLSDLLMMAILMQILIKKLSDNQLYGAMDKLEMEFKNS